MNPTTKSLLAISLATILVAIIVFSTLPETVKQQLIGFCILYILLSIRILPQRIPFIRKHATLLLLFFSTFLVQLLVLVTGGLTSPFFMLLHFYTLGISFLLNFPLAFIFLGLSTLLLIADGYAHNTIFASFYSQPESVIFIFISLFIVLPVADLLSRHYKLKDRITAALKETIRMQSSVLDEIKELVFITDQNFTILSINEKVEKDLSISASEILGKSFFDVVLLKDTTGKLAKADSVMVHEVFLSKKQSKVSGLKLFTTSGTSREVSLTLKPVVSLNGQIFQLFMVISDASVMEGDRAQLPFIEEIRLRLLARIEHLQQVTYEKGMTEMYTEVSSIAETQHDINTVRLLDDPGVHIANSKVDLARLAKETVARKKAYFTVLGIGLGYELLNFGIDDVKPLVPMNFHINLEEFTGPFFTVNCQVSLTNTLIAKLLEVAALLASNQARPQVQVSVERVGTREILIVVTTHTQKISQDELNDIFISNYKKLAEKLNFRFGTGLEGYIVKRIVSTLDLPFRYQLSDSGELEFIVSFKRE